MTRTTRAQRGISLQRSSPMVSRPFLLLVLLIVALAPLPASAQGPATGTPPFSSFSGGPDIVNNGNLNDHWAFPIRHKPGRGTDFAYDLGYDSSVYYPVTSGSTTTWQPVPQFGWSGLTATGYATSTSRIRTCRFFQETRWVTESYTEYDNWTYFEGSGTSRVRPQPEMAKVGRLGSPGTPHPLIGASFDPAPDCGPQTTDATLSTNDGSGYKVGVSIDVATTLYTAEGLVGSFGTNTTDRNGNQITLSNGVYTDTLGTTALTVTGTGTAATPYVFTYTAPSGASAHYTLNYTNFTLSTNFCLLLYHI